MTYKITDMRWKAASKDDLAEIERMRFKLNAGNYKWVRRRSIWPRRCYWSNKWICPFSYAMVSMPKPVNWPGTAIEEIEIEAKMKRNHKARWICEKVFVVFKLDGTING